MFRGTAQQRLESYASFVQKHSDNWWMVPGESICPVCGANALYTQFYFIDMIEDEHFCTACYWHDIAPDHAP